MTRHTLHARIALLAVACLLALAVVPSGAGGTATQTNDTTLAVTDATLDRTETAQVRVSLDDVPAGLAGYEVTLELRSAGVANVTGASYPDAYRPTTDPVVEDGRTITLEAADIAGDIEPGAENVTLATVNVSGVDTGSTRLVVTGFQVDADNGSRVSPALDAGAVTVGDTTPVTETAAATDEPTATDPPAADASTEAAESSPATDPGTATTIGAGPGFGAVVALIALAGLTLLARRD